MPRRPGGSYQMTDGGCCRKETERSLVTLVFNSQRCEPIQADRHVESLSELSELAQAAFQVRSYCGQVLPVEVDQGHVHQRVGGNIPIAERLRGVVALTEMASCLLQLPQVVEHVAERVRERHIHPRV